MRFDKGMAVRGISAVTVIAAVSFLAACGGGGGGGSNLLGVSVGLSASATSVSPGQTSTITAFTSGTAGVTWSLSPAVGTLSGQTTTSVTYTPPPSVPSPSIVTITATSIAKTSVTAPIQIGLVPAVTIALAPMGPQTVNPGQPLVVNATVAGGVTWTLSPASGSGTLTSTTTSATYTAPNAVSGNVPVTLTATSISNSGSTASVEITVLPSGAGANVAAVTTDNGTSTPSTNTLFTSVTVCAPATSNCQTIDNILVDTGSEGLRVLQSALGSLVLPPFMDSTGDTLNNCVQFLDTSYLWGPVELADIKIGSEATSNTLIQVISSGNPTVPTACSNSGGANQNTPTLLGANGILGIGLEPTDCILAGADLCDGSTTSIAPAYYLCASSGCATTDGPTTANQSQQVTNPVVQFGADSNGSAITLPALSGTAAIVDGKLVFGIGTKANNTIPLTATGFITDGSDNFSTTFNGQVSSASFIDSGSNGLFFPSTLTACTQSVGFYCPTAVQHLMATNMDGNTPVDSKVENFDIDNADNLLLGNTTDSAFSTLGGPLPCTTTPCTFDWGLPFFYGKTVFTAIDGQNTPIFTTGPFWAY